MTSTALDSFALHYYRTVALLAGAVAAGADLPALCEASPFANTPALAALVCKTSTLAHAAHAEGEHLVERLSNGALVHEAVAVEHARACLCLDVVACVAKYHDDQVAQFWLRQLAA